MSLITSSDFATGKYKLALNHLTTPDLTACIAKYEPRYLQDLFGVALYNLFVASYSSSLPTGVYLTLYNEFAEDNENSGFVFQGLDGSIRPSVQGGSAYAPIVRSEGIKEMLKGFIYFEYCRESFVKNTITGNVKETTENSEPLTGRTTLINQKYNEAVNTYCAIQWYIREHSADYPDFHGVYKEINGL